ncbi:C39 family peptidase [Parasalinivibrio latis]|uniref:C39 family peptidase n=1 Tax=Parasalinivibrio latis TaxID=2952610 RepID=UPI0030E51350
MLSNVIKAVLFSAVMVSSAYPLGYMAAKQSFNVDVESYQEKTFGDVIRQQFDFSCGSAAVASLASYHYNIDVAEDSAFKAMFDAGDRAKIEKEGFSLFDMRQYLHSLGLQAEGYKLGLDKLRELGVPVITLVNFDGYHHFVLIKGINDNAVILGDPSRGIMVMEKDKFLNYYREVVLLVVNRADEGRDSFITDNNFSIYESAPTDSAISREAMISDMVASPAILGF